MDARGDSFTLAAPYSLARGTVETFSIANPGAGANFSRTVGQGYFERLVVLSFALTTSAVVANRQVALAVVDADGNDTGGGAAGVVQTASTTTRYYVFPAASSVSAANPLRQNISWPAVFLQPGWRIQTNTAALDAGDAFVSIRGIVERFGIGPDGTPVGETELPYTERGRGYVRDLESE